MAGEFLGDTMQQPAIPALLVEPQDGHLDFRALYAIARAYAHSGLLISEHGHQIQRVEFTFPAVICSSFALELFLKFFLMVDRSEANAPERKFDFGHNVPDLWAKITPAHKALIAGSFRNSSGTPKMSVPELRLELFEKALADLGDKPFVQWRYIHELRDVTFMSHGAITLVVDALGFAAQYVMKGKSESRPNVGDSA